jgi:hypothetical protein
MSEKPRVQVVIGKCLVCGGRTESADPDGLKGLTCARGHKPVPYEPVDAYYEDEAATWEESA